MQIGIAFALAMWLVAAFSRELGDNIRLRDLSAAGLSFYVMMLYALATIVPTCAVCTMPITRAGGVCAVCGRSGVVCAALLERHGRR